MNIVPSASLGRPRSNAGSIGSADATSALNSPTNSKARPAKRGSDAAHLDSSGSDEDAADGRSGKRRPPGVKRACNECRQQKLKCDVLTEPTYQPCERCRRLKLTCKIDSNFRRVGKRSEKVQMEKEIKELRAQLANYSQNSSPVVSAPVIKTPTDNKGPNLYHTNQDMESGEAVASLMDLANGAEAGSFMRSPNAQLLFSRRLGEVFLNQDQVQDLFQIYFKCYHPFLPLLDPAKTPDEYFEASKLLFWVIISVASRRYPVDRSLLASLSGPLGRLLWQCISEVPQSYNVVKSLCLLCTWPFPVSSTSLDPSFIHCSLAMSLAMQQGLHRPSHIQDFTKYPVSLREEELKDRVRTWAACNAVAQRVSTGYGQPPLTMYDCTLAPQGVVDPGLMLPREVEQRLHIERFVNHVTESLYMDKSDVVGLATDRDRAVLTKFLASEYKELEQKLQGADVFTILHLRAAGLHLRLSAFFDSPESKEYYVDLLNLYEASTSFLEYLINIQGAPGTMLPYSTNYILQMLIAASFSLLKLLNSFFASYVDQEYGKALFNRAIWAIRSISVKENDLPSRFAEVLAQFWRSSGAGSKKSNITSDAMENSLQLKVKCRMSMSLVYDSAWRWRQEFQAHGKGNLETAVKNPTMPESTGESSSNSVTGETGLGSSTVLRDPIIPDAFGEAYSNEVFDPLNWIFDGDVPLPINLEDMPLDGQAIV